MADQNVEVVRAVMDAYFRGDEAAMLAGVAPDVIATQFPDQLDVRDYHGHDGLRELMADWIGMWDDWTIEILSVREVDNHVLVSALQRGQGKVSGAPIEDDVVFVFTLRGAAIARWQMFHNEPEAVRAMGLEE